jgi:hypothetical protein
MMHGQTNIKEITLFNNIFKCGIIDECIGRKNSYAQNDKNFSGCAQTANTPAATKT